MTVAEFMVFVSLVCNFDSPISQVPRIVKEDCMEYYVNCAIKDDGKISRLVLSNCNIKSKDAAKSWGSSCAR